MSVKYSKYLPFPPDKTPSNVLTITPQTEENYSLPLPPLQALFFWKSIPTSSKGRGNSVTIINIL